MIERRTIGPIKGVRGVLTIAQFLGALSMSPILIANFHNPGFAPLYFTLGTQAPIRESALQTTKSLISLLQRMALVGLGSFGKLSQTTFRVQVHPFCCSKLRP